MVLRFPETLSNSPHTEAFANQFFVLPPLTSHNENDVEGVCFVDIRSSLLSDDFQQCEYPTNFDELSEELLTVARLKTKTTFINSALNI